MLRIKTTIMAVAAVLLLAGCGAKKNLTTTPVKDTKVTGEASASDVARGVFGNACYQSNVVSKLTFNLQTSGKNISVPGSLHMRWNDVIRLQLFLPILGTEVGRLEFTQDYVLIVDRIHKQYIKANYNEVDFLKDKGINFHSLQALLPAGAAERHELLVGSRRQGSAHTQGQRGVQQQEARQLVARVDLRRFPRLRKEAIPLQPDPADDHYSHREAANRYGGAESQRRGKQDGLGNSHHCFRPI